MRGHVHTQECCELDCPHELREHDEGCGYIEAVEGQPCTYACAECAKGRENGLGNSVYAPEMEATA